MAESTSMCLAYTSFAVRMLQGRDILKSTAAALPAGRFIDLCASFGAGGCQLDLSQLESHDAGYLAGLREQLWTRKMWIELSVPSRWLESAGTYREMAGVARALGATRLRVALLYGRRYESFKTRDEWLAFAARWRQTLLGLRPAVEAEGLYVGIENHKDFTVAELVALLREIDSPYVGACVDFGNNLALLEDPLETVRALAPYAVTTHLKDMAVRPFEHGFHLSEVPLGTGLLPLAEMIRALGEARPDARLCLEMITRDPLAVPWRREGYWTAMDRTAVARAFAERLLAEKAWASPLPATTGLTPEQQIAAEDDNVRRCLAYGRETLGLSR